MTIGSNGISVDVVHGGQQVMHARSAPVGILTAQGARFDVPITLTTKTGKSYTVYASQNAVQQAIGVLKENKLLDKPETELKLWFRVGKERVTGSITVGELLKQVQGR